MATELVSAECETNQSLALLFIVHKVLDRPLKVSIIIMLIIYKFILSYMLPSLSKTKGA